MKWREAADFRPLILNLDHMVDDFSQSNTLKEKKQSLIWHLCWVFKWHLSQGSSISLDTGWSSSASLGLPCCVFRLRHRVSSSARGSVFFTRTLLPQRKNEKVIPRRSLRCTENSLEHRIYANSLESTSEVGGTNTFAGKSFRISTKFNMSSLQILLHWLPASSPLLCIRLLPILILSDFTSWVHGFPMYSIMIWHFAQQVCRYPFTATMSLSSRWAKGLHLRLPCHCSHIQLRKFMG